MLKDHGIVLGLRKYYVPKQALSSLLFPSLFVCVQGKNISYSFYTYRSRERVHSLVAASYDL